MSRGHRGKRSWGDNGWGERGGYMNAKKQKLADQFAEDTPRNIELAGTSTSSSKMFEGISIHVNGYTVPSSDELKRLMMLHGGMYYHYYSKTNVSHIIATQLPYAKIKELKDEKIVKPEWILDSIKSGKLLSDVPYQLYTNRTTLQGTLHFKDVKRNAKQSTHKTHVSTGSTIENISPAVCPGTVQHLSSNPTKTRSGQDQPESVDRNKGVAWAGDANFVSEFYSNSRLHHISTWGAEFKTFVNKLQSSCDSSFPGREKVRQYVMNRRPAPSSTDNQHEETNNPDIHGIHFTQANSQISRKAKRVIMHVDMDCFFVSVGLRNRPDLIGKPVAVTHSKGKGMTTVNQETRELEKAYYENKYKQYSDKGLKSQHSDQTKASLTEAKNTEQTLEEVIEESPTSKAGDTCTNPNSGSLSAMLDRTPTDVDVIRSGQGVATEQNQEESKRSKNHQAFESMAEIASCSYEARKSGVKNGMFMGKARKYCPDLQTIPYDFEGYKSVAQTLYETVASFTHDIEAVSCDEMFVDLTDILEDTGATPLDVAHVLRQEIKQKTQCNASAGLACNILLARMSTRKAKPNGQFYLEDGQSVEFMKHQQVKDLPGVGWSTGARLETIGIDTCGDLQSLSLNFLQKEFGPKTGQSLYNYCRGIDNRPIRVERERKSVSAEINYGIRFTQKNEAEKFVSELAEEVHKRLTGIQMIGRTITLKLRVRKEGAPKQTSKFMGHGICDNLAKSTTMPQSTDKLTVIQQESKKLLAQMQIEVSDLRGVGIQISRLSLVGSSASCSKSSNQSLLDFVKPMPKISGQSELRPTTDKDVTTDQVDKEKKISESILKFVSKQKLSDSAPSQHGQAALLPPPLPVFSPTTSATTSRLSTARLKQREQFCLPSPSQLDPSVMAALPSDIRETIEQSYKAQRKQTRKIQGVSTASNSCLNMVASDPDVSGTCSSNSVMSPGPQPISTSDSSMLSITTQRNSLSCHLSNTTKDNIPSIWDQPSTSNATVQESVRPSLYSDTDHSCLIYDPHVLKELPADIVQEIMEQEGSGMLRREAEVEHSVVINNITEDSHGPVQALPSFSQVDPSCLEALPSELQRELQLAYQRQQKSLQDSKHSRTTAETKPSSPFKLHRRRGRPRKFSPHKGTKQGHHLPNSIGILELVTGVKCSPAGKVIHSCSTDSHAHNAVDVHHDSSDNKDVELMRSVEPVNLCGAVTLQDVKALLKEWTTSVEDPGDEDINHLVLYLKDLIMDRNVMMTDFVLRAMKRLANGMKGTSAWRNAYQIMEDSVQDTLTQIYRTKLKIM